MPSSLLEEAPAAAPAWRRPSLLAAVGAAVLLVAAVTVVRAPTAPDFVPEVGVANPTDYSVHVSVSGDGRSWLGLGVVPRNGTRTFHAVVDQGDTWTFRFRYAGETVGTVRVGSDELRAEVPAEVGVRLRQAGYVPSLGGS